MAAEPENNRDGMTSRVHRDDALRVLFVASEVYPLAKTGGLADVSASLPARLARQGIDVRLLMPGYTCALEQVRAPRIAAELGEVLPGAQVRLVAGWTPDSGVPIWLIDCPSLFQRPGTVYQDPEGNDWEDNALRFGLLSHVAARVGLAQAGLGWRPDIVHVHDWHTGLVPLLLRRSGERRPLTVFTVHNAAFQGCFPLESAKLIGLDSDVVSGNGIEFYGQLSFLKAGLVHADKLTTVSPSYAREIQTPEHGSGLEGLYQARADDLVGIMNGIDATLWNPATDSFLPRTYSADDIEGKHVCKASLQDHSALYIDRRAPLVAYVSRLTQQKMADVVLENLPQILARNPRLQVIVHGRGDKNLEKAFTCLALEYPGRLAVRIGYEESYAHRLQAGADILLHGSRFEPCGLTQLYAMRYGTIPVVRRVGGLADSVVDASLEDATGFVFEEADGKSMSQGLQRCIEFYQEHPDDWSEMQARAMRLDFSWSRSARKYIDLYYELISTTLPDHESDDGATRNVKMSNLYGSYEDPMLSFACQEKQLVPLSKFG
ncbi:MAG TPA: glycogen synthase GlgA [Gammaproteobacteria bacterium]|nr:glycogen synthase GlgA [Gammaproteobacteria bacterium]